MGEMRLPHSQSGCDASVTVADTLSGHAQRATTRYYLYYRRFWRF